MDLVRTLTSGSLWVIGPPSGGPEGNYARDEATAQWRVQGIAPCAHQGPGSDILHGGPEVSYARDPATGRWLCADRPQIQAPELAVPEVWVTAERGPEGSFVRDPSTGRWCHAGSV